MAIFNSYAKLPEGTVFWPIPAGWWCNNHLEKWWSSPMGRMTSHIWWKIKNHVWNHQPVYIVKRIWIDDHFITIVILFFIYIYIIGNPYHGIDDHSPVCCELMSPSGHATSPRRVAVLKATARCHYPGAPGRARCYRYTYVYLCVNK